MRILTLALAGAASLLGAPALAQTGYWYGGADFGATHVLDIEVPATGGGTDVATEYGYDADAFLGYDLGRFRIEVEAAYKNVDVSSFDPASGASVNASGSIAATSLMLNAMMDFGDDEQATSFFVGAGLGSGSVEFDDVRAAGATVNSFDTDDDALAFQVFGGGRVPINERTDLKLTYRYFKLNDVSVRPTGGVGREVDFDSHSVLVGLVINFGAPVR